jgi:hypothetical protein
VVTNDGQVSVWSSTTVTNDDSATTSGVTRLSDSKFIVIQQNSGTSQDIFIGSLDANNAITIGAALAIASESTVGIARLSDSSFFYTWRDASADDCMVTAATVSGTTITAGSAVAFDAAASDNMAAIGLDSARGVVAWVSAGATVTSAVVNVSGTTVSAVGTTYNIESTAAFGLYLDKLDTDKIIIAYTQSSATDDTKCAIATISGNAITWGSTVEVHNGDNAGGECTGLATISKSSAVVSWYHTTGTSATATAFSYITISGTTPTIANTITVDNLHSVVSNARDRRILSMVNGHVLMAVNTPTYHSGAIFAFKPVFTEVLLGVAKSAPVSNVVPVIKKGRTGALYSGLTFGKRYMFDLDGTISEQGVVPGGVAISTTELFLD